MVQLSKRKVKPEAMSKMLNLLFDLLGKQRNKEAFNTIIDGLFSPVEKIMIAKRVAVLFLISREEEWSVIRDLVKVSLSSISKCQMILKNNIDMKNALDTISNKKEIKLFIDELFMLLFGPGTAYVNWKRAWKRKKELELKKSEII